MQTTEVMREQVVEKLKTRMEMKQGNLIPILQYLHFKLTEQMLPPAKILPPLKTTKSLPDRETQKLYMLQWFKEGKAQLVDSVVPGALYYKGLMHQKARQRAMQRKNEPSPSPTASNFKSTRRNKPQRQPRSLMAIRESLRQMMEAEVIKIDTEHSKKKLKSKFGSSTTSVNTQSSNKVPDVSRRRSSSDVPKSGFPPGIPDIDYEPPPMDNNNNFIGLLAKKNDQAAAKQQQQNSEQANQDAATSITPNEGQRTDKKNVGKVTVTNKPVLVTETASIKQDQVLPSIVEEKTQEDLNPIAPQRTTAAKPGLILPQIKAEDKDDSKPVKKEEGVRIGGKFFPAVKDATEENAKSPSKWGTAMKFVNQKVQDKLAEKLLEAVADESNDHDVHNYSMRLLENKIDSFNIKYGGKAKVLPPLARYQSNVSILRLLNKYCSICIINESCHKNRV